ncbi:glycosyltransferase family 2 protein [Salinicoccus albus]|uniref:glycosyltransferase family 2 protein n=1 Tax=Salinicoccus albus TaxID=418756 RepID=UPI00036AB53F|nr:glycosyltransferase family 2 protein [Salinicoccus albus]
MADTHDHTEELKRLTRILEEKEAEKEAAQQKQESIQMEFDCARSIMQKTAGVPRGAKRFVRAAGAYVLGRRNRKQLYSRAYKQKDAHNQLKKYTYHLYELGFTGRALKDLEQLYYRTKHPYLRMAAAWELSLWHANKYTVDGAQQALCYLLDAIGGRQDEAFLRKAAIITAECLQKIGDSASAKALLMDRLEASVHPDLYLALANQAESLAGREAWINRALELYDISPITFNGSTYENLAAANTYKKAPDGPKVTVIMPAYQSADGIGTGIDSILNQTWQNIELLVVDDCSMDGTAEAAKRYAENDGRVKILSTPANSGPYAARNLALSIATGEFVTINDADDWSHPQKIETQVRHLMMNDAVIANTSEHARLTEALTLHRRGTPGTYIFPNMSSLMFRRQPAVSSIGYWDAVRFAADSEFKRRITAVFGSTAVVDLNSGPLSFPRQASGSLTGSSAFGYKGFLMGIRKEYAEVHRRYHQQADSLYHPFSWEKPPYPVPEPMWIAREQKTDGFRHFDVVMISDFRMSGEKHKETLAEIQTNNNLGLRTGLVQMARYDFSMTKAIDPAIRKTADGTNVQMLVYGENIDTEVLLIKHPAVFMERQAYVPNVKAKVVRGVIDDMPMDLRRCTQNASEYTGKPVKWYPGNDTIRADVNTRHASISQENWEDYVSRLEDWIILEHRTV